jgi:hypothetical protein
LRDIFLFPSSIVTTSDYSWRAARILILFAGFFVGFSLLGLIRFAVIRILRPLFFQLVSSTARKSFGRDGRNELRGKRFR